MRSTGSKARAGALSGAVAIALSFAAQAQDLTFDIPAGDLNAALTAYSKQTGQQVVFKIDDLKGKTTPGVHGAMTPEQALTALLAGTGLKVQKDSSGAIAIFPAEAVAGGASTKTAGDDQKLEEVIVTATAISSIYVTSRSVTRVDADPMDLPMSISAVQEDLLRQQQARSVTEALTNVAGMDVTSEDRVYSRGFEVTPARNGSVALNQAFRSHGGRPVVATDRIEVVKGPMQIMQGSAAQYGGTVNVITKVPDAGPAAYLGLGLGSREYWRLDADLNDTLLEGDSGRLMGRLIGSTQDQGDTRVGYRGASNDFVSTGLRWEIQEWGTDVSLVYEYNDGWSPMAPTVVTTGRSFGPNLKLYNFGEDNQDYGVQRTDDTLDFNFTQSLAADWKLAVNYLWTETSAEAPSYNTDYNPYNPFSDPNTVTAFTQAGKGKQGKNAQPQFDDTSNLVKASLYGLVNTGPLSHHLLLAYDYTTSDGRFGSLPSQSPICITDLSTWAKSCILPDPDTVFYFGAGSRAASDSGVLLSDRIQWNKWSALIGVRWAAFDDRWRFKETVIAPGVVLPGSAWKYSDSHTLPQYGLVYEASSDLSLYASGTAGYEASQIVRDADGRPLPNPTSTQYEIGLKSLMLDRQIAVTLALYQINQKDVAMYIAGVVPPPGQDAVYMSIDGIKSEGVEVEISGQPVRGLEVRANYAYLSTKAQEKGQPVAWGYTPNKFNLWTQYWFDRDVGTGWWAGGGLNYSQAPTPAFQTQPFESLNPPITVVWPTYPGSTIVDLSVGWNDDHWSAIGGIKNATNERVYNLPGSASFITSAQDGRTYAFDVGYKF